LSVSYIDGIFLVLEIRPDRKTGGFFRPFEKNRESSRCGSSEAHPASRWFKVFQERPKKTLVSLLFRGFKLNII